MRTVSLIAGFLLALAPAIGATLEKLSLEEMIEKSTSIVRAKVVGERTEQRGQIIYRFTNIEVLEQLKGPNASMVEVALPGGTLGGLRQEFSGVPELRSGVEYVLFLWEGKNGITHVIGLSQGVFTIEVNDSGKLVVHREASGEVMLDPTTGQPMQDRSLTLEFGELRDQVRITLNAARR